jgi:hypothetical protein
MIAIRPARIYISIGLLGAGLGIGSCLGPTELRLHVHTNVPCTDSAQWKGVAVYTGVPGESLEAKAPALTTTSCDENGQVGSLVVVPSGSKDDEVGLRVVAGLSYHPEECASHQYQGCIVARRAVRFDRHTALDLDIELTSDCVGFGCDATHTCVAGTCADTRTMQVAEVVADAGPSVRCGDNGVYCPTSGNVCCLTVDKDAGTAVGECKDPAHCPPRTSIVLNCDDETDCASLADDAGHPGICALSYMSPGGDFSPDTVSLSECVSFSNFFRASYGLELCESRQPCLEQTFSCHASLGIPNNPLPGYFWCDISNSNLP